MKTLKSRLAAIGLLFFAAALFPSQARSHAFPMRAEPKVGSEIKEPPTTVKIWFDGDIEPAFSSVKVIGPDGKEVDGKDPKVDEKDHTLLIVSVPKLAPGKYQVKWEVVALDTHRTEGDFTFVVK